jgi:SAM-dependent methyltransferase
MIDGITQDEVISFYNNRVKYQARHYTKPNPRHDKIKDGIEPYIKPGILALDIGCGIGIVSKYMAELGARVISVDISPKLIQYAKENYNHENIKYITEDIHEYMTEYKFDLIVIADVLEHLVQDKVQNTIIRLLSYNTHKNTMIYLNVPDRNFIHFMEYNYPKNLQIIDHGYSIGEITDLFSCCEFVPIEMKIYGTYVAVQYNEYVFMNRERLTDYYKKELGKIYNRRKK